MQRGAPRPPAALVRRPPGRTCARLGLSGTCRWRVEPPEAGCYTVSATFGGFEETPCPARLWRIRARGPDGPSSSWSWRRSSRSSPCRWPVPTTAISTRRSAPAAPSSPTSAVTRVPGASPCSRTVGSSWPAPGAAATSWSPATTPTAAPTPPSARTAHGASTSASGRPTRARTCSSSATARCSWPGRATGSSPSSASTPTGTRTRRSASRGKATYAFDGASQLRDAALAPDGGVVMVGETTTPGCATAPVTPGQTVGVAVVRTSPEGLPAPGFGVDGRLVVADTYSVQRGLAVAVQPDGAIVVGGRTSSCSRVAIDPLVFRLTAGGAPDAELHRRDQLLRTRPRLRQRPRPAARRQGGRRPSTPSSGPPPSRPTTTPSPSSATTPTATPTRASTATAWPPRSSATARTPPRPPSSCRATTSSSAARSTGTSPWPASTPTEPSTPRSAATAPS